MPGVPFLPAHYDTLQRYHNEYLARRKNGQLVPFTLPYGALGCFIVMCFLMIPPTSRLHSIYTRYATFSAMTYCHLWIIWNCKTYNQGSAFVVGAMACWGIIWTATLLIFNDAKRDFKRLALRPAISAHPNGHGHVIRAKGKTSTPTRDTHDASITHRKANGHTTQHTSEEPSPTSPTSLTDQIYWQPYPMHSLATRFLWCLDLFLNFRGISWNWKISGTPSYPLPIQHALLRSSTTPSTRHYTSLHTSTATRTAPAIDWPVSRTGIRRSDTLAALLSHNAWLFTKSYLAIDLMMTYIHHDAYFRTGTHTTPPPPFLPLSISSSPALLRALRLYISMSMVRHGLRLTYTLSPFFFAGILGPDGLLARLGLTSPRGLLGLYGEPWLYPDHYGDFSNVARRGLAGWWGSFWHMVFRFAFEAAGRWAGALLGLRAQSGAAAVFGVLLAFALSGLIHLAGSVMQNGETWPWTGAFVYFMLQPVGMAVEAAWRAGLKKVGVKGRVPGWVGQVANLAWVYVWMWLTGGFLADDFARGGLWLAEPLMVSPARGLGYGVDGDGWFCWSGVWVWVWRDSERWWQSGLAL